MKLNQLINKENQVGLFSKKNKNILINYAKLVDFLIKKFIIKNAIVSPLARFFYLWNFLIYG